MEKDDLHSAGQKKEADIMKEKGGELQ